MEKLRVTLTIDGVGTGMDVHPIFSNDVNLKISREENQIFHRQSIEGEFRFVKEDFAFIESCGENITFGLNLYRGTAFVGSATFNKTDCTFNYDDRVCSVKLKTSDRYEGIISHLDDERNIVKLAPQTKSVTLTRRGVLQLYIKGSNTISNIVGGMVYEQSATEINEDSTLVNTYKFRQLSPMLYIVIEPHRIVDPEFNDFVGEYSISKLQKLDTATDFYRVTFTHTNGLLSIRLDYRLGDITSAIAYRRGTAVAGRSAVTDSVIEFAGYESRAVAFNAPFYDEGKLYARYLCPSAKTGTETTVRPTNDICDYDRNYPFVCPYPQRPTTPMDILGRIQMVIKKSTTPTPWGIDSEQKYFTEPILSDEEIANGDNAIPFGKSHWEKYSMWIVADSTFKAHTERFNETFVLRDAYSLWSVIHSLVTTIDNRLSFGSGEEYSEFLAETSLGQNNPLTPYGFLRKDNHRLFITPITNLKSVGYEQAAQRGDISLRQVFDMLRNVFQCYWWIDDDYKIRIEHISYFKNGNAYNERRAEPAIDVTQMLDYPNLKKWSFCTNEISHDNGRFPSRYEFAWGDNSTSPFNGVPIDIKDKSVSSNSKESVVVENFISDIDYALILPNETSNDLFALLEVNNLRVVPISDVRVSSTSPVYKMQNGLLSFLHLEKTYYPYDLSGWDARIGDSRLNVFGVKGARKQKLSFPCTIDKIKADGVIRGELGDGLIEEMSVNAETLMTSAYIRLKAEKDYIDKVTLTISSLQGIYRGYLTNNSDRILQVTYATVLRNVMATPITITMGVGERVLAFLNSSIEHEDVIVLGAKDISPISIGRIVPMEGGVMTYTMESQSGKMKLTFNGNQGSPHDYIFTTITARKDLTIKMTASTEGGYDYGWVDTIPRIDDAHGAERMASGEDVLTFTMSKGESRYIGYTKDVSGAQRNDTIVFEIE